MGKVELTIEVDADLVKQVEATGEPLNATIETALRAFVEGNAAPSGDADARAKAWAEDNAEAISAYNQRIARRGVFGADLRRW